MKIRLEIPKAQELPSQGRNRGSIPLGGATERYTLRQWLDNAVDSGGDGLFRGHYTAFVDTDKSDSEFVYFVGWTSDDSRVVFERGSGELLVFKPDEVDIV